MKKVYTNENGDSITVSTDGHVRELVSYVELPELARDDFDYMEKLSYDDQNVYRFVKYRGEWYDVNDGFERLSTTLAGQFPDLRARWDGIQTQNFFSGLLIRYVDRDCESVVVGRCYW